MLQFDCTCLLLCLSFITANAAWVKLDLIERLLDLAHEDWRSLTAPHRCLRLVETWLAELLLKKPLSLLWRLLLDKLVECLLRTLLTFELFLQEILIGLFRAISRVFTFFIFTIILKLLNWDFVAWALIKYASLFLTRFFFLKEVIGFKISDELPFRQEVSAYWNGIFFHILSEIVPQTEKRCICWSHTRL